MNFRERTTAGAWRRKLRWRRALCGLLTLGRHWWDAEWSNVEVRCLDGLTDEELENDVGFVTVGRFRLCRICYVDQTVVVGLRRGAVSDFPPIPEGAVISVVSVRSPMALPRWRRWRHRWRTWAWRRRNPVLAQLADRIAFDVEREFFGTG